MSCLFKDLQITSPKKFFFAKKAERRKEIRQIDEKRKRLKMLKIELAQLAGIYSDDHPDI